jgi:hypothetical protein
MPAPLAQNPSKAHAAMPTVVAEHAHRHRHRRDHAAETGPDELCGLSPLLPDDVEFLAG